MILGGAAADRLYGGLGKDTLAGGDGNDWFVFDATLGSTNVETIQDFVHLSDKIVLDDDIFTQIGIVGTWAGVALTAAKLQLGTAANDAGDRLIYNSATGALFYDADGNGAQAQVQIATLTNLPTLTAADFLIIA